MLTIAYRLNYRLEDLVRIRLEGRMSQDPRDLGGPLPEVEGDRLPVVFFRSNLCEIMEQIRDVTKLDKYKCFRLDITKVLRIMCRLTRRLARRLETMEEYRDTNDMSEVELAWVIQKVADITIMFLHVADIRHIDVMSGSRQIR